MYQLRFSGPMHRMATMHVTYMEAEKGNFSALSSEVKLRSEVNLRSEGSKVRLRSEAPKRSESPK